MIQISKPIIKKEEMEYVHDVLKSGHITQGKMVAKLEKKFAEICGTKYAIAVNNGTAALHSALYALGLKPGDEVITTPFTFVATANSILMVGAQPVFCDIDEKTFNIDPTKIESRITSKTRAILVVDLYGQPAAFDEINRIAKKHKLFVVEDAAQSVGATYQGNKAGNLADIGTFSLYATKNLMSAEGGMITTNNKKYYEKIRLFRNHGQDEQKKYYYTGVGYNYRMSDIHAALGLAQLKREKSITKKRNLIASRYTSSLSGMVGLITPEVLPDRTSAFHQYTLRVTKSFAMTRDEFKDYLFKKGIQSNVYYPKPLYTFPHLKKGHISSPVVERLVEEVISIPVHPSLTDREIEYIISTILNYEKN